MRRRFLLLSITLLLASSALADSVTLNNGNRVEGIIVFEDSERLVISTPGGDLNLRISQIAEVVRSSEEENALFRMATALRMGNMAEAMRRIIEAYEADVSPEMLNDALIRQREQFLRGVRALRPTEETEIRHQLRRLRDADFASPQLQVVFAEAFLELDSPLDSSECLMLAGYDYLRDDPEVRDFADEFLRRLVRELARQGRYEEAVRQIERLRLLHPDDDSAAPQMPLLYLSAAARAREEGRYEDSLRLIREELQPTVPEIARNRALLTMRQMAEWAERTENEPDARRAIQRYVDESILVESIATLHRLYETEAKRMLNNGQPNAALALINQLSEEERGRALELLRLQATFHSERRKIGGRNPADLFQLSIWAADNDLYDEAINLLTELRENPNLKDLADRQMRLILHERDLSVLNQAIAAFDRGQMQRSLDLANSIELDDGRESPVLDDLREVARLARSELRMEIQRKPYDAEVFYQQAERAYFMEQADEAWRLIDLILSSYAETPAAQRATGLLPDVLRLYNFQLLEGKRRSIPDHDRLVSHTDLHQSEQLDREIRLLLEAL